MLYHIYIKKNHKCIHDSAPEHGISYMEVFWTMSGNEALKKICTLVTSKPARPITKNLQVCYVGHQYYTISIIKKIMER